MRSYQELSLDERIEIQVQRKRPAATPVRKLRGLL
jgi:hypothetical protein